METTRLFDLDSHIRHFQAVVLACEPAGEAYDLMLDQTAFFPEGGGQPPDKGTLNGMPVLDVREHHGVVLHRVACPLRVGSTVEGSIEWPVRFSLMQQHSGEHIVSGLIRSRHGFDNVGFHIGTDCVTVDFNGELTDADLEAVEDMANEAVFANLPIGVDRPEPESLRLMSYRSKISREEGVRIVSIPGVDVCACCGTHVAHTGEIGLVKILSGRRYKGGTRVEMLCGGLAVRDYGARHRQVSGISVALSAKPLEVAEAVRRLLDENETLKRQVAAFREARLEARAESAVTAWCAGGGVSAGSTAVQETLPAAERILYPGQGRMLTEEGLQPAEARRLCVLLVEKMAAAVERPAWIGVLSAALDGGCLYAVAGVPGREGNDARRIAQDLNAACSGRGGGSPALAQGSVQADIEAALACLRERKA